MSSSAQESGAQGALRRNAIGTGGIVFFVVAAAGPMAAIVGASPLTFGANGVGTTGTYAIGTIIYLLFSVGFAAMTRHVSSAGGFAMLVSRGLGARAGFAAAAVAVLAYNATMMAIVGLFSFFARSIFLGLTGIDVPWPVWAAAVVALVGFLGYRDVHVSAHVLGVLMILEVLILVVFAAIVLVTGGHDGLNAEAFRPAQIFSGDVGLAFLFAFSAFIGVEATVVYGEEARNPERTVPRATYIAVALTGGFYVLVTYAIGIAYGTERVVGIAAQNPDNFVFDINTQFVGAWSTLCMKVLVITSLFAVLLAVHNTCARYLYALGRARLLPEALGTSHARHASPHRASLVETLFVVLVVGLFLVLGKDPFDALYAWLMGLGTVAILVLQFFASLAVIGFFRRTGVDRRAWTTRIAPALAALGLAFALVLSLVYFDTLTGVSKGPVTWLPMLVPLLALAGFAWGVHRRKTRGASLDAGFVAAGEAQPPPR
jgi:amino acid transporter